MGKMLQLTMEIVENMLMQQTLSHRNTSLLFTSISGTNNNIIWCKVFRVFNVFNVAETRDVGLSLCESYPVSVGRAVWMESRIKRCYPFHCSGLMSNTLATELRSAPLILLYPLL